ncbi:hypothetical protein ACFZBU_06875 [Embleya sp. NPDC008237]|uniref:hypothetical protein n=1 Tax=Embleya sp. NPDC008237 TaxID=3363978 RepID=UPI0036EEECC7
MCDATAYVAGHDGRITCVHVEGLRGTGSIGPFDESTYSAAVVQTSAVHGSGPAARILVDGTLALYRAWEDTGRPGICAWHFDTTPRTAADGSVMHVPNAWSPHTDHAPAAPTAENSSA